MERDDDLAVDLEPLVRRTAPDRFGKYRNLRRIGQGGMADVFLAGWRGPAGFNKLVVVKRLRDDVAADAAFREMFLDEARLAARLNHPNVVQTYEVFEDDGAHYITMEYLEGQPLSRLVRECEKLGIAIEPPMCARIVSEMLCGLHYAHEARDFDGAPLQIVHRDVSPQNIFVTYDGQIKVVDFGIAKAELSSTKTQVGFFKGKAAYMAPEQLEGGPIDRRVDVFTAGIILWELLVGRKLMAAESTAKTLVRLLKDTVPRVAEIVPHIDPALDDIVARALERDPAARYQTAGEMRNALEKYLIDGHHAVRSEDIGQIVADVFSDVRSALQKEVSERMSRASSYPASGSIVVGTSGGAPISVQGMLLDQPASMSGISVSRTASSVYSAPALDPGIIVPGRPSVLKMQSIVAGAIISVSVAIGFAVVERTRTAPATTQVRPTAAVALPPVVNLPGLAPPRDEVAPPDPPRPEAAAVVTSPPPAPRPVQPSNGWRPAHSQSTDVRASAASRSSPAVVAAPATATQVAAPAAVAVEAPVAHSATPPSSPSAPPPAAAAQEGRKFRTSL